MAQVSDTWGPESHARKPNTLRLQPPTSSSYKQAGLLWRTEPVSRAEQQGGYFWEEGSPGEGSPPTGVRGWEEEGEDKGGSSE